MKKNILNIFPDSLSGQIVCLATLYCKVYKITYSFDDILILILIFQLAFWDSEGFEVRPELSRIFISNAIS